MSDIQSDILKIATFLYENKYIGVNTTTVSNIIKETGLETEDFYTADGYLLESKYTSGTLGGDTALRSLTSAGINFVLARKPTQTQVFREANINRNDNYALIDVFISHSSQDVDIARSIITLLRGALSIPPNSIRCTSVDGYRLPAGAWTDEYLRLELRESKLFIALITEASLQSTYVLFELGARWGANLHMIPVLAAGATPQILPDPIRGINVVSCDVPTQLHQLVQDISKALGLSVESPAVYQKCIDEVVEMSNVVMTKRKK